MKQYTVEIADEEFKALEATIIDIQEWVQHSIKNKARKCIDRLIDELSEKNTKRMSIEDKLKFVKNSSLIKKRELDKQEV